MFSQKSGTYVRFDVFTRRKSGANQCSTCKMGIVCIRVDEFEIILFVFVILCGSDIVSCVEKFLKPRNKSKVESLTIFTFNDF